MSRKNWIIFASIWLLFIIFLIPTVAIYPMLNSNINTFINIPIVKDVFVKTGSNSITSFNQLNNFVLSYGGVQFVCNIASYTNYVDMWRFFVISETVILPLTAIATVTSSLLVGFYFIFRKVRLYKLQPVYKTSIILAHVSFYATFMSLFFGLLFVSFFWGYIVSNKVMQQWYGSFGWDETKQIAKIGNFTFAPESFNLFALAIFRHKVSGLFSISSDLVNHTGYWCLQAGFVFLFILTPLFLVSFLIILAIRINTSIQLRNMSLNRSISNFNRWLIYINISTKKEFKRRVKSNVGLLMIMVTFAVSLLFPAFAFTDQFTLTKGMIMLAAILLLVIASSPIYYIIHSLRMLQQFSYNKLLFLQMVVYTVCGSIWQFVIWIVFKAEYLSYHDWVAVLTVGLYLISCYTAFVLLIKGYR